MCLCICAGIGTICKPDEYKININNEIGEKILFRDSNNIRSKKKYFFLFEKNGRINAREFIIVTTTKRKTMQGFRC